ncbi:MAG: hypothetical protein GC156_00020 [Actinomycetales bacterium]|nr:hypothetical protein [Actinomycetales bacterium]
MWNGNGAGSWWLGMVGMIVLLAVLVGFGVWAMTRITRPGGVSEVNVESPRTILDRRFASGELDAEAYAEARRVLEGHGSATTS